MAQASSVDILLGDGNYYRHGKGAQSFGDFETTLNKTQSVTPNLTEETTAIDKVTSLFITVFSAGLFLGGVGGVVMVIVAGMRLLGSAGDTEEAEGAKSMLIAAVVGVLVIGASLLLVQNLLRFFYWA